MILAAVVIVFTSCVKRIEDNFSDTTVLKVNTKDPILTEHTVMTGGDVTKIGRETVTERGICYGTQPYPDITGSHILSGSGTGSYTSTFNIEQNNVTYYIRAYATNANGISYGEQKIILGLPTFQYNGSTYYVAPDPGTVMTHSNAVSYCENYGIYGVTGWTLPTINELTQMYANRASIGGFIGGYDIYYHSSTSSEDGGYYVLSFYIGDISTIKTMSCRVRPIKKMN